MKSLSFPALHFPSIVEEGKARIPQHLPRPQEQAMKQSQNVEIALSDAIFAFISASVNRRLQWSMAHIGHRLNFFFLAVAFIGHTHTLFNF